jgi:hypothetical protein
VIRSWIASAAWRSVKFSEYSQDGGHHQLSRGDPRPAPPPERGRELLVGVHLAQLIANPHRQIPFRERRMRHHRGELRNIRPGPRPHRHDDTILRPDEGKADRTKIISRGAAAVPEALRRVAE